MRIRKASRSIVAVFGILGLLLYNTMGYACAAGSLDKSLPCSITKMFFSKTEETRQNSASAAKSENSTSSVAAAPSPVVLSHDEAAAGGYQQLNGIPTGVRTLQGISSVEVRQIHSAKRFGSLVKRLFSLRE